jgi:hypothetical protein
MSTPDSPPASNMTRRSLGIPIIAGAWDIAAWITAKSKRKFAALASVAQAGCADNAPCPKKEVPTLNTQGLEHPWLGVVWGHSW